MASEHLVEPSQFKHNELVWAKVTGHPWWPAQIHSNTDQSEQLYQVDFFGYPASQAFLPNNKIIKF